MSEVLTVMWRAASTFVSMSLVATPETKAERRGTPGSARYDGKDNVDCL
jgi:hypothetical protein